MKRVYSSKHADDEIWDDNGCPICREMSEKRKAFYNRPVDEDEDNTHSGPFETIEEMWLDILDGDEEKVKEIICGRERQVQENSGYYGPFKTADGAWRWMDEGDAEEDSNYIGGSVSDNVESDDREDYYGPFKTVKEMREWLDANN
jgi:hypothetical protein